LSLWRELGRRNVIRVGLAYLAGAWLSLQVVSILLPAFGAPSWVLQAVILAAAIGLLVALVLAWIYEWTPEGIRAQSDVPVVGAAAFTSRKIDFFIIGLLVLAVLFLILEDHLLDRADTALVPEVDSIAVLSFENLSNSPDDEYFSDGLADEILSTLGRIQELRVASRMASFYFKGKDVDLPTIAGTLRVKYVLSGAVRRYGDRIRVTAALDDPATSDLVWSETFDREVADVLDIQTNIARSVATAIVPVLSERSERQFTVPPTASSDAYDFYLRGRDYLRQPAEEATLVSAVQLFDRAIGLDPSFAQAYAGSCEAHLGAYYVSRNARSLELGEAACGRALALNDSLWEVRVARGTLYRDKGEYANAVEELEAAIEQQPTAVAPYIELAQVYAAQNLVAEAEEMFRRAQQIESGYWRVHNELGNFFWHLYRYSEAIPFYQRVIDLTPDSGIGYDNLGVAYQALGEYAEAERAWNESPQPSRWTYSNRGLNFYHLGEYRKAVEDLGRAVEAAPEWYVSWGQLGDAYRHVAAEEENAQSAYARAIQLAERELRTNPAAWEALARLAMYYAYSNQPAKATDSLEELFRLTSDPAAYYFAARAALQLGDTERAREYRARVAASGWSPANLRDDPDLAVLRE